MAVLISLIPDGGWIETIEKSNFNTVVDSTQQVMGGIQSVIDKIDHGEGVLGMLLNQPMEMKETLHYLSQSSENLSMILERLEKCDSQCSGKEGRKRL